MTFIALYKTHTFIISLFGIIKKSHQNRYINDEERRQHIKKCIDIKGRIESRLKRVQNWIKLLEKRKTMLMNELVRWENLIG